MADRLSFAEIARLPGNEVEGIAACLASVLGPALAGAPAARRLVASANKARGAVDLSREHCLDICAELLELASGARRRGREVHAFALEGVEARLLDALVESSR